MKPPAESGMFSAIAPRIPWYRYPLCAVCNKPVDKVFNWVDRDKDMVVFVFMCHGSEQTSFVLKSEMEDDVRIDMLRCFEKVLQP